MSHVLEIQGTPVRVKDTLGDYLLLREMLSDAELSGEERFQLLLAMLYEDGQAVCDHAGEGLVEFVDETAWRAFGLDLWGNHDVDYEPPVMDWDEDHNRIVATVRRDYGLSFEDLSALPYTEAASLIGLASHESPMGQAIYYRTAEPPERTKYNGDLVDAFNEARDFYELGKGSGDADSVERASASADAQFEALRRLLQGG